MKLIAFALALITLVSFLPPRNQDAAHLKEDPCKQVLDSARVLVENGIFTVHWQKTAANYERFTSVSIWLEHRPFSELKCLMNSSDPLYRMIGYMNATQQNMDSLDRNYSFILDDTTSLQDITPNGIVDAHMTIGQFLKKVREEMIKENEDWAKEPELQSRVKSFIRQYARYPSTYQSISFPFFSMGSETGRGRTDFRLRHVYKIENNNRQMQQVMSEFVFDDKFHINVIAKDSSSTVFSIPPMIGDWLKTYGRHLTPGDSVALRLK